MKKILLVLPLFLIIFGFFLFFKIQNVISNNCPIGSEIKNNAKNKNIFSAYPYIKNILSKDKTINKFSINLVLPYDLQINCLQKIPIAAFKLDNGNFALADTDGFIIGEVKDTNLPKITKSIPLDSRQIAFVSNLMFELHNFYNINEGEIKDSGLEIANIQGKKVIFPLKGDIKLLLGEMNLIFSRLKGYGEASTIGTIDLRFTNPVLR